MPTERVVAYEVADTHHHEALRVTSTVLAAAVLAVLSNGPSVTLSRHFSVPLGWERWPYLLPMGTAALVGVFLCGRDLAHVDLRPFRVPLCAVGFYTLWTLLSVLWSVAPDATATRSIITAGVTCFAVWFAISLQFREQVLAVYLASALLTLSSFVLVVWKPHEYQLPAPSWLPSSETSAFGVFGNPNSLGPVAAVAVLASAAMCVVFPAWKMRLASLATAAIGVVLVLWSRCETAIAGLALCIVALLVIAALPMLRKVPGYVVAGGLVLVAFAAWRIFFDNIATIASWVGGDPTLSSRRTIWHDVRQAIGLRLWKGYGFFGYWDDQTLTAATYARVGKAYGSAHNSILEVALGLGLIGLSAYIVLLANMVIGIARSLWKRTTAPAIAWALLAVFACIQNSMESFVLWHSYLWALFVAAAVVPARLDTPLVEASEAPHPVAASGEFVEEPALAQSGILS